MLASVSTREAMKSVLFSTILQVLWVLSQEEVDTWPGSWRGTSSKVEEWAKRSLAIGPTDSWLEG